MSDDTEKRGISFGRIALLFVVVLLGIGWAFVGTEGKQRILDGYYEDFVISREAERHPFIARLVATEQAVQAAEEFAADYRKLQESNIITAPLYVWETMNSHDRLEAALGGEQQRQNEPDHPQALPDGVKVVTVESGSSAAKAGIRPGDDIVAYSGEPIANNDRLREVINSHRFGAGLIVVTVRRNGRLLKLETHRGRLGVTTQNN